MNDSSPAMNGNASDWAVSEPGAAGKREKGKDESSVDIHELLWKAKRK